MINNETLKGMITRLEIDGVTIDKDREYIYPSYQAFNADGDRLMSDSYDIEGEDYNLAKASVNEAVMNAVAALQPGEVVDVFAVIEQVMYAGALRRLGLDL